MHCFFCQNNNQPEIDIKNTSLLERFISSGGKIRPRKKTGLCRLHQRRIAKAIKKARQLGFLPYVKE